jgi:hypothetical protein
VGPPDAAPAGPAQGPSPGCRASRHTGPPWGGRGGGGVTVGRTHSDAAARPTLSAPRCQPLRPRRRAEPERCCAPWPGASRQRRPVTRTRGSAAGGADLAARIRRTRGAAGGGAGGRASRREAAGRAAGGSESVVHSPDPRFRRHSSPGRSHASRSRSAWTPSPLFQRRCAAALSYCLASCGRNVAQPGSSCAGPADSDARGRRGAALASVDCLRAAAARGPADVWNRRGTVTSAIRDKAMYRAPHQCS